jgi:sulfur carrier protein ThiS
LRDVILSIELFLTPTVQYVINDVRSISVEGRTVIDCLADLVKQYPQLRDLLFNEKGKLLDKFMVYANGEIISPEELSKPVGNGDRIHIVDVITGG